MNEFNSQVCTSVEQSKRLLKMGLKPETADMSYYSLNGDVVLTVGIAKVSQEIIKGGEVVDVKHVEIIPAWSLHRLMIIANIGKSGFTNVDEAYNTCISLIASHFRFGLLNKEYFKQ